MTGLPEPMNTPETNQRLLPTSVLEAALEIWSQAGKQYFVPITGCSMLPLIQEGDRVLVAHSCASARQGDVIVFRRGGRLVAHRVLRIYRRQSEPVFITKGDNVRRFDPPVNASEVVGRVLTVEREGWQMALDTAAWRAVGWLIALSTLAWIKLYGWGRRLKRRLWGPRPSRLTAFLRRSALAFFALATRVAQAVLWRWKDG
jgi:signal peptidase I